MAPDEEPGYVVLKLFRIPENACADPVYRNRAMIKTKIIVLFFIFPFFIIPPKGELNDSVKILFKFPSLTGVKSEAAPVLIRVPSPPFL